LAEIHGFGRGGDEITKLSKRKTLRFVITYLKVPLIVLSSNFQLPVLATN
jgi:hypothetical protein